MVIQAAMDAATGEKLLIRERVIKWMVHRDYEAVCGLADIVPSKLTPRLMAILNEEYNSARAKYLFRELKNDIIAETKALY